MTVSDDAEPVSSGYIDTPDGHSLFYRRLGDPNGVPLLLLHGGPGTGMDLYWRDYVDLGAANLIMFDQRGVGASVPAGALHNNTTSATVHDCALVLRHFNIDQAIVVGGSWGASLAIEFAKAYRDMCCHLFIYSVFLARPDDETWFLQGARRFFPDFWDAFTAGFSESEKGSISKSYWEKLQQADSVQARRLAAQFGAYMTRLLGLEPEPRDDAVQRDEDGEVESIRIFLHYSLNSYFLTEKGVMQDIEKLAGIPGTIVHGRYDMDSPLLGAYELEQVWPDAKLHIVPGCGHSDREPQMREALQRLLQDVIRDTQSCPR